MAVARILPQAVAPDEPAIGKSDDGPLVAHPRAQLRRNGGEGAPAHLPAAAEIDTRETDSSAPHRARPPGKEQHVGRHLCHAGPGHGAELCPRGEDEAVIRAEGPVAARIDNQPGAEAVGAEPPQRGWRRGRRTPPLSHRGGRRGCHMSVGRGRTHAPAYANRYRRRHRNTDRPARLAGQILGKDMRQPAARAQDALAEIGARRGPARGPQEEVGVGGEGRRPLETCRQGDVCAARIAADAADLPRDAQPFRPAQQVAVQPEPAEGEPFERGQLGPEAEAARLGVGQRGRDVEPVAGADLVGVAQDDRENAPVRRRRRLARSSSAGE